MGTPSTARVTSLSSPSPRNRPMASGTGQRPASHSRRLRSSSRRAARLTNTAPVLPLSRHTVPAQLIQANSSVTGPLPTAPAAAALTSAGKDVEDFNLTTSVACPPGVVVIALPESASALKDATWQDVEPYYQELQARPLDNGNVEGWLQDWSDFESLLYEAGALANFYYVCNTADSAAEKARLRFASEIDPKADERRVRLQRRLIELDYKTPELETAVRRFRNQMEIFNEANVPLFEQLARLSTEWSKVIGSMTVEWEGVEKTPPQMLPYQEENDRSVRERAFRKQFEPYIAQRDAIAGLFDRMYDLRQQVAKNAGFDNYRDYAHREKNRFDYTPDDCLRFHAAVEEAVLPAVQRLLERRRERLGLDRLRPWDLLVDPKGRQPLKPYATIDEFIDRAGPIYASLTPDFRRYFDRMAAAGMP